MTRIDELRKKYPTIPKDVIVQWEVHGRGVRDSDDLDRASDWRPAVGTYQNKFDDLSLKEMAEKRPSRINDGRMLRPTGFFMKSGAGCGLRMNPKSPYEVRETGGGKFAIYEGEDKVDVDIYFPRPKPREGAEPVTSRGTPISRLVAWRRHCFTLMPVRYCEYFALGDQCKFCNFNSGQDDARSIGLNRPVTENLEEVVEAYKIRAAEVRLLEGRFELGGFVNAEHEERIHLSFIERVTTAAPYKPNFTIHTEAMPRKGMQRLKDAGLDCLTIQIEAWDADLFPEILPGKARHTPFEGWLESVTDAVDVFGAGNVAVKTLGGLTLIPENGHKTWQEARDTHIEHVRWATKNGAIPCIGPLSLPAGSVYGETPSLREKLPPAEYYLDLFLAHDAAMKEHGLYAKLNKFMYCGMCCSGALYFGDLGILERAGDWGNWMADVVPDDANWILQFIRSVTPTAPAKT